MSSRTLGPWTGGVTPVKATQHCLVFYAGLLLGQGDFWPDTTELPDGAYIYYETLNKQTRRSWHHIRNHSVEALELDQVPPQLRAIVLLLT